jgi:hypothetical protein
MASLLWCYNLTWPGLRVSLTQDISWAFLELDWCKELQHKHLWSTCFKEFRMLCIRIDLHHCDNILIANLSYCNFFGVGVSWALLGNSHTNTHCGLMPWYLYCIQKLMLKFPVSQHLSSMYITCVLGLWMELHQYGTFIVIVNMLWVIPWNTSSLTIIDPPWVWSLRMP